MPYSSLVGKGSYKRIAAATRHESGLHNVADNQEVTDLLQK